MGLHTSFQDPYRHASLLPNFWESISLVSWVGASTYSAAKNLNFDLKTTGERTLFQLNEMDEFQLEAYKNVKLYKEWTKKWNDMYIQSRKFEVGQ